MAANARHVARMVSPRAALRNLLKRPGSEGLAVDRKGLDDHDLVCGELGMRLFDMDATGARWNYSARS